ncbi:hypothetical protein Q4567_07890 [Aliiglaciecola sp. 2_MG-2023]|uniref:hypothetical protein n=1 Tax=unclassified Aliiglaciecola TaxID=2593648 RepID=UPI0026E1E28D|nr:MULTISPECIES: hypothetical protein [unclassified Aliiglaciecola]MDO6710632.1 hypothetical protein [Aliiglaciecola sp. 2_MG-2023]MDO6754281.1 hypothetical protein [Aliiglaciecola sp. 1_MG-2023]
MLTEKRFFELTRNNTAAIKKGCASYNNSNAYIFEPISLARVTALSEILGMEKKQLVNEMISCALGDAHNGFLSAFDDKEKREEMDHLLKSRVKELLNKS